MSRTFFIFLVCLVLLFIVPSSSSLSEDVELPVNPELWMTKEPSACLPTAIMFKEALNNAGIWSILLHVLFTDPSDNGTYYYGHYFVVFIYPKNSQRVWVYDKDGSWLTSYSLIHDPISLVKDAFEVRGHKDYKIIKANFFIED
jgi:hypothetical protein